MKLDLHRPVAALLLGAFTLPAQQKLDARSFLPEHYQAELFADLDAMRECEFFDGIERSAMFRMVSSMARSNSGIDVNDLTRVRLVTRVERATLDERHPERTEVLGADGAIGGSRRRRPGREPRGGPHGAPTNTNAAQW